MLGSFTIQGQEQTEWCWLAVAASVADYFAGAAPGHHSQCALAQALVSTLPPGTQCCGNPTPTACDQPGLPSVALAHVNHSLGSRNQLASFADIANELTNGNPVALRLVYTGSGVHHVVAAIDAFVQGTQQFLEIDDPDGPFRSTVLYGATTYQNLQITWGRTYFTHP